MTCPRAPNVRSSRQRWQVADDGLGECLRGGTRILTALAQPGVPDDQRLAIGRGDPEVAARAVRVVLGADRGLPRNLGDFENRDRVALSVHISHNCYPDVYERSEIRCGILVGPL